ncbi:MAG: acyl-CoA thioesterase-1 [Bacteroidia bacterium]|jgi:acyl-CoA thioesterase-1
MRRGDFLTFIVRPLLAMIGIAQVRPGGAPGLGLGRRLQFALLGLGLTLVAGCGGSSDESSESSELGISPAGLDSLAVDASGQPEPATMALPLAADAPKVVVLGDSLAAGLHLPSNEAWPAVLANLLAEEGLGIDLVNAGVSGDTTAGGLARMDWLLRQNPDLMIVELGGNDGLRGVSLKSIEANVRAILKKLDDKDVDALLLGMKLPTNYGQEYTAGFEQLFVRIAEDTGVPFVAFFLEGVAMDPDLNLPDGLHPNTAGHRALAQNLLPVLRPLVRGLATEPSE